MNISKELFQSVTGIKDNFWIDGIHIEFENGMLNTDINDFFFKCKEWAYKNEYDIWSITWGVCEFHNIKNGKAERFEAPSEQQAVFNACQWILENKDN